jgi:hypothetical protein
MAGNFTNAVAEITGTRWYDLHKVQSINITAALRSYIRVGHLERLIGCGSVICKVVSNLYRETGSEKRDRCQVKQLMLTTGTCCNTSRFTRGVTDKS